MHRLAWLCVASTAFAVVAVLAVRVAGPVGVAAQAALPPAATVRLSPADAQRLAREGRQSVSVQVAGGLELSLWAPGVLVADPIALDIDSHGTMFVTASPRSGQLLDIRQHPDWVPDVLALKTVDDLRQFFQRVLAPDRSAANTWLPDANHDGSRDWRDLLVIKERIYRLQDTAGDGVADLSQVVYEGFNQDVTSDIAGGVMFAGGDLYVSAAPDLWKLRDTDGDGTFDTKESISTGYSIHPSLSGHDLSAVTLGPDGRIYWKVGDIGLNVVDRTGGRWAYANQGAILRANPDGSDFEVFAAGLRNTQEIGFDDHGNLIAVDNDGDYPGETERVVYITRGSDAGWRSNWQYGKYTDPNNNRYNVWIDEGMFKTRFDGQAAYIVPPIAPYHAGPAGFAYNPGTALDEQWRGHFFVTSFTGNPATSRVYAFRLNERGAGFDLASDAEVLRGICSPGMKFGPDGALYLTDWIKGFGATGSGRVWKLDVPTGVTRVRADVQALLQENFSPRSATNVRTLLGHADMRVRQKAQFELVRRLDSLALLTTLRQEPRTLPRIHALWGLGQLARRNAVNASALVEFLRDADSEVRAQAARVLGDVRAATAADALVPLLKDSAARPRFFAAEALGRVKYAPAAQAIVQMLAENDDRDAYLRHAGSSALAAIGDTSALAALAQHSSRAVRLAAVVALRRLRDPGVARFLADPDELVVTEAARAINDDGGIDTAVPALARLLDDSRSTSEALLRRAISANARLGTSEAADRLAAFAARSSSPRAISTEAVTALGVWLTPSPLDRVDGAYLAPAAPHVASAAHAAGIRLVGLLQATTDESLAMAVIDTVARLDVRAAAPALMARLRGTGSLSLRSAALRALTAMDTRETAEAIHVAIVDRDPALRMLAIDALALAPLGDAAKVAHLATVLERGSVAERRRALQVAGKLKSGESQQWLDGLLDRLEDGRLPPDVQLDVLEAARANGADCLQARLAQLRVGRSLEHLSTIFPESLQRGGDAAHGRQVALLHPATLCTRCHTVADATSTVGPSLRDVGSRLSRDELLNSLVGLPSAHGTVTRAMPPRDVRDVIAYLSTLK